MKGVNGSTFPKEFFFVFAAMPGITGFFFSIFDVYILSAAFFLLLSGRLKVGFQSLIYILLVLVASILTCMFSAQPFVILELLQWALFLVILVSCWWLLVSGFFDVRKSMYYWMMGIVPNFIVAVLQNVYPQVEIFNFDIYKSSPLPGYDFIRSTGLLYNPNTLAAFSAMAFWLALLWGKRLVALICVLTAVLTFSKTVFLMSVLFLLRFLLGRNDVKKLFCMFFGSSFSLIFLVWILDFLSYRMTNANSLESRMYILEIVSTKIVSIWQVLFGLGIGADAEESIGRIHNKFLSVFFQFGLLGAVLFFSLMIYICRSILISNLSRTERFSLLVFLLIFCSMGMVSTWTFFSFEYIVFLFCLKASKETHPIFEKI